MFGLDMNDPKKMAKMMKKLNMNVKQIEADRVVIEKQGGNIVINKPEIMVVDMMGRDVYQIMGSISSVNEDDVTLVMGQTGKDRETVVAKLEELNNDLAKAIKELGESDEK